MVETQPFPETVVESAAFGCAEIMLQMNCSSPAPYLLFCCNLFLSELQAKASKFNETRPM
jgi:hypothetical protein